MCQRPTDGCISRIFWKHWKCENIDIIGGKKDFPDWVQLKIESITESYNPSWCIEQNLVETLKVFFTPMADTTNRIYDVAGIGQPYEITDRKSTIFTRY